MSKSPTTIDPEFLPNPTPGEILLEDFLRPFGLSQTALATRLHVSPRRINEIVLGKRAITADTDLRMTRYFNLTPGFFLRLQADHDLMEPARTGAGARTDRAARGVIVSPSSRRRSRGSARS